MALKARGLKPGALVAPSPRLVEGSESGLYQRFAWPVAVDAVGDRA